MVGHHHVQPHRIEEQLRIRFSAIFSWHNLCCLICKLLQWLELPPRLLGSLSKTYPSFKQQNGGSQEPLSMIFSLSVYYHFDNMASFLGLLTFSQFCRQIATSEEI